jgi:hypothetical protein
MFGMIEKLENSSPPRHRLAGKNEPPSRPHVVVVTRPSANSGKDALHNLSFNIIALFEFVFRQIKACGMLEGSPPPVYRLIKIRDFIVDPFCYLRLLLFVRFPDEFRHCSE